jgi:cytochrome c553
MKSRATFLAMVVLSACCFLVVARAQTPAPANRSHAVTRGNAASPQEGERRLQANCGRCHNPPDSLSPREVKAVLRHMRVRAMLSAEDERLILEYLAP